MVQVLPANARARVRYTVGPARRRSSEVLTVLEMSLIQKVTEVFLMPVALLPYLDRMKGRDDFALANPGWLERFAIILHVFALSQFTLRFCQKPMYNLCYGAMRSCTRAIVR